MSSARCKDPGVVFGNLSVMMFIPSVVFEIRGQRMVVMSPSKSQITIRSDQNCMTMHW